MLILFLEVEEVPGHMGEDDLLEAGKIHHPVTEGLLDGLQERLGRVGTLEVQEPSHLPDGSSRGVLLDLLHILIQPLGVSPQTHLLFTWTAVGFVAVEGGMVSLGGDSGLFLGDEPFVIGHLLMFP